MRNLRSNSREKDRQEATRTTTAPSVPPATETSTAMLNRHLSMDATELRKEVTNDIFGQLSDNSNPSIIQANPIEKPSSLQPSLDEIQSSSVQDHRHLSLKASVPVIPIEPSTATVTNQTAQTLANIPPEEANQLLRQLMLQVHNQSSTSSTSRPVVSTREFAAAPEESLQYSSSASYAANVQRQHLRNAHVSATDHNSSGLDTSNISLEHERASSFDSSNNVDGSPLKTPHQSSSQSSTADGSLKKGFDGGNDGGSPGGGDDGNGGNAINALPIPNNHNPAITLVKHVRPLEFPKYDKKNHRAWINAIMRCCDDHPETTQAVRIGEDFRGHPKRYFLDPWPVPVKEKVYDALIKSLPSAIFNEVATANAITFSLGDIILRRLNEEYGLTTKLLLKMQLNTVLISSALLFRLANFRTVSQTC